MFTSLVMTVMSPDRPGLVEQLARTVAQHGGNWLESRMCRLGGQFVGLIRVELATEKKDALLAGLESLAQEGIRITALSDSATDEAPRGQLAQLELVGQDRPGILLQISKVLAAHKVNVEDLSSECVSAPIDGSTLFQAKATVLIPSTVLLNLLRQDLERIASDLMVDVRLQPAT